MANYSVTVIGARGISKQGATTPRSAEVALGGRIARDLWENPAAPPGGVVIPSVFSAEVVDHQAIPHDEGTGTSVFDDDETYLYEVLDGDQAGLTDLVPTLKAWAAALDAAENP